MIGTEILGIAAATIGFVLAYGIVSMFHVVLGELAPKSLAIARTRRTALSLMVMALAGPSDRGEAARTALFADDEWAAPAHMPLEVVRTLHKAASTDQLAGADADAFFFAAAGGS